ncbi:MAG: DinB family protein [Ferruginibacter sp.]
MNKDLLLRELDASIKNMLDTLSTFDKESFTIKPSDIKWSAAQVTEHLLLLEAIAIKALSGETIPTNRAADEKIALIKWAMEDATKRQAPETVQPSNEGIDLQAAIEKLKQQRDKLREVVSTSDVTEACISIKHPALGTLTKWEWVYFTIYHMQRHLEQIKKLT